MINRLELETWKEPHEAGPFADIVVPPEKLAAFSLEVAGIDIQFIHEDLGASIANERHPDEGMVYTTSDTSINSTWFTFYHDYADHSRFLNALAEQHSNNSEIIVSGKSYQGNNISAIHIYGSSGKGVKPAVVFHGTIHAREWITTMVVEYFADFLLAHYDSDPEIKAFIDKYDFYIYPVVNPDGFIFSQTDDRLWRKNRQPNAHNTCLGTDINRNWPYKWGPSSNLSIYSCAEEYAGGYEGDTPEVLVLSTALNEIQRQQGLKLYVDWHSYSQVFLTPYGQCDYLPANIDELKSIASGATQAMGSLYGTVYDSGTLCEAMYPVSGGSIDYVMGKVGGDYAFAVELRDKGTYGFLLPPDQILPTSREAFEGVKYLLRRIM